MIRYKITKYWSLPEAQENKDMDRDKTEEILLSMVSLENCQLVEVDQLFRSTSLIEISDEYNSVKFPCRQPA